MTLVPVIISNLIALKDLYATFIFGVLSIFFPGGSHREITHTLLE